LILAQIKSVGLFIVTLFALNSLSQAMYLFLKQLILDSNVVERGAQLLSALLTLISYY
jgi:hypothetical protein